MNSLVFLSALVACAVAAPQNGFGDNLYKPNRPPTTQPPQNNYGDNLYKPNRPPQTQSISSSASGTPPGAILIINQEQEVNHDGTFRYNYETQNGISSRADGEIKNAGSENEALVIRGSYSYLGDNGVPVVVTYIADENGFQPQSDILPTPPPVPEAIQRALDYLRSLPPSKDDQRRK